MRQVIFALGAALAAIACGPPQVELPTAEDDLVTPGSDGPQAESEVAPQVNAPKSYPYARLALRGSAANAVRIFVEGAGNPRVGEINPVNGDFCVDVDLTTVPAQYTLSVRSQANDGSMSKPTTVEVSRANDAPEPDSAKLCDGTLANKKK